MKGIETILLQYLHMAGIQPTQDELDDFQKRLITKLWNGITKDRMDERLVIKNAVDNLPINLPNGRVGEQYKTEEIPFKIEGVVDYDIKGLESTGLSIEKTDNGFIIKGVAAPENIKGGDFPLVLRYKPVGLLDSEEWLERKLNLVLNPDPKTLWKNIPTKTSIPYYKPDFDIDYVKVEAVDGVPRKDIVAASQRGRSHAHEGNPRDDHFKLHYCKDSEWYIIAVADGAGSAQFSRKGSEIACNTVVDFCKNKLNNNPEFEQHIAEYNIKGDSPEVRKLIGDDIYGIIGNAAYVAHKKIREEADQNKNPIRDYSTTLLLAICKRFDFGWFIGSFWVGDGAMCVYDTDSEEHTAYMLGMPDEGEFAGQTRFLTMSEIFASAESIYNRLRFCIRPDFTALMLMTDGVSDPKFETDANLQDVNKWDELWQDLKNGGVELTDDNEESKNQLLNWLDFWSPGNHDDRTIAILY